MQHENTILLGDCLERLHELPDGSVDQIVTDPPYGYSFMGKDWDKALPSVETWRECLRVLKPGAFAFIMSAPRQDVLSRMIVNIGDAGFDTDFTSIYWTYASGFPKAMNIGKMVDRRAGVEREVIGVDPEAKRRNKTTAKFSGIYRDYDDAGNVPLTTPTTEAAKALAGSYGGFQPKPAVEVIIVAMKPLSEKTFVDQALKNGKGVTWLDDTKIPADADDDIHAKNPHTKGGFGHAASTVYGESDGAPDYSPTEGRFPANLLVSDSAIGEHSRFFSLDAWWEERIQELPESVQRTFPYLVVPKASKAEKNKGLEAFAPQNSMRVNAPRSSEDAKYATVQGNIHPTVKPIALMSYLVTLGSRPGDLVLDPFVGSGTTCIAAKLLSRRYLGIEKEPDYWTRAVARVAAWQPDHTLPFAS